LSSERSCSSWTVNLLQEKLFEWLLEFKKKISIKVVFYVCCMQRMQHIFNRLIFNEQISAICKINANILQKFFIFFIFFLFFNANLIEKCKALKIKVEMLNFVNDINILVYNRFIKKICKMRSKVHNAYAKWVCIHDVMFTSEKYELTHFTRKLKRFNMMTSIQIKSSIIKLKSDVQVLKIQLNIKLWWDAHLQ